MKKKKEIKQLKSEVKTLKERITKLESKDNNVRNAGRKPKFNQNQKRNIYNDRMSGMTVKALADKYKCGTTTINRIVAEFKKSS